MTWLKRLSYHRIKKLWQNTFDSQQKLILLIALPSLLLSSVSLSAAGASGYLIAFIVIVFLMLTAHLVVASRLNADYQTRTLSNLIESMIDGDYSLRGRLQTNAAFQELLNLINHLSETLARHKFEAKESRLLLERILEQMNAMVLATDQHGRVVMANASARKLMFHGIAQLEQVELATTAVGAEIINAETGIITLAHLPVKGEYFLVKETFLSGGHPHQMYFITNAERLLIEQERKAWQSLLRVLSHEMNNSLTPIAAISQSMQSKLQQEQSHIQRESLLEGINIINERAESLSSFIASYSQLSHLPKPNKCEFSLAKMLNAIAALFPELHASINESCQVKIAADKSQFEQVLINIFKNAAEATTAQQVAQIEVSVEQDGAWLHIYLRDTGCGVANVDNLFVPFYTTKKQGSGIGLALCRQILFNHNGLITLKNRHDSQGVEVKLSLPYTNSNI